MLKVFDKNLNPTGVLPDADQVQRKRRINSDYELSFLVPMNSTDYTEKITLKGHVQDERGQYFVINSRKRDRGGLKRMARIDCMHIMFKLTDFKMPYDSYIEEGFGVNINTLANLISSATSGKFSLAVDSGFELKDIKDFGRGNALQALNFLLKTYDAEVEPDNFVIRIKKKIGVDSGMQYRIKKNIISNSFEDDARALVTRMYSQMKDGLTFIGLPASHLTPEEYNLLNAVPGAIVNGVIKVNYLISPYAAYWANNTNTYYDGELIDQNIEDQLELLEATRKALKEQEVPTIDVNISAADLHKIDGTEPKPNLGDTVYLIDPEMELNNMTARVVEITEYPFALDKHSEVSLANFMRRDFEDIIADLDRAKQIVDDITSGAKIRTTVFEAFAKQAIYDINNSKTEVKYDQRGIILQDKENASNQVVQSSNGIYITTDGGATARAAITARGVVAEVIVGILGEFAQVRTDNLIAGNALIKSALIESLKVEKLDASSAKISTAMIESLVVGNNVQMGPNATISWGKVTDQPFIPQNAADVGALATNSPMLTYIGPTGIYTGTLNANQINVGVLTGFTISAATITGGTINVQTDINVGSNLYLNGSSSTRTIFFGNSGAITANGDTINLSSPNGVTMTGNLVVGSVNVLSNLEGKASKGSSTSSTPIADGHNHGFSSSDWIQCYDSAGNPTVKKQWVPYAGSPAHSHTLN
ncbi:phage tail protein [Paenibacillus thermotolerans]|uniref:phage tail protein n=1 Tax=Paenibacillus thermotolerans TaxID=3027807 RepID=UPI0023689271|nr:MULTISPECIES: phage tail spike protein [unclassified Paenibacillus]